MEKIILKDSEFDHFMRECNNAKRPNVALRSAFDAGYCKYCLKRGIRTKLIKKSLYKKSFDMDYCPKCDIYFG
jgi:hypothetical protein